MGLTSAIFMASAVATSSNFVLKPQLAAFHVQTQDDTDEEACELVNGVELSIGEGSDSVAAYLLTAVKNNNGIGILLLSDIFGFEESSTRDFAYRIACNGYKYVDYLLNCQIGSIKGLRVRCKMGSVLLPDLFNGDPWQKDRPMSSFDPWLATHTQTAIKNITTSIKWMVDEFFAAGSSKKFGVIGFCFGGGKVIDVLSNDNNDYFALGVSFYGTRIQPSVAAKIKVPVLYITGDEDPLCSVQVLEEIDRDNVGGSKVVVFKGRGHGFVHRPASAEDDQDAEEAFTIMRNWLHNGLVVEKK
ncbi:carboxymethylenebutenolidase [Artemisia annua]|uniref:Carboxymethylenebutenolidase homolog n=1 Tax=Artemisia annua TaxID=35608 RepID=A0A2U1LAW4_ARTAN|nr:carboxymethylenebutenolidase [Artemisia annua]